MGTRFASLRVLRPARAAMCGRRRLGSSPLHPEALSSSVNVSEGEGMNIPRRNQMRQWCEAERAIHEAVQAVERMPADVRLTDAVILLGKARDKVADFVDYQHAWKWQRDSGGENAYWCENCNALAGAPGTSVDCPAKKAPEPTGSRKEKV